VNLNEIKKVVGYFKNQSGEFTEYMTLISRNNHETSIEVSGSSIIDKQGKTCGIVLVFRDITEKRQKEEKIKHLSFHDNLTGLYNRAFFEEELKRLDALGHFPISLIVGTP